MIPGICSICGRVSAILYNCNICGRLVCPSCFDFSKKVCKSCSSKF